MANRKQTAIKLLEQRRFAEAKDIILQLVAEGDTHFQTYAKLGDIAVQLNQPGEALRYFQQAIDKNPMHESSLFKLGKLYFSQQRYDDAEACYAKCKTPRACVFYHRALCLLQRAHAQDAQTALTLLSRAVELKPNEVRYHRQYARSCWNLGRVDAADTAYAVLLALTDFQDAELLAEHARFLSECKRGAQDVKQQESAAEAVHYQPQPQSQPQPQPQPAPPDAHSEPLDGLFHPEIKLIIYDFDETITYANLWNKVNGDIVALNRMSSTSIVNEVFGGNDRIDRLMDHFDRVLSSPNQLKIAILSFNSSELIVTALRRVGLIRYFDVKEVFGSDNSPFLTKTKSKRTDVLAFANDHQLDASTQILFVDNDLRNIEAVANDCITYHVQSEIVRGLTRRHCQEIEQIVGVHTEGPFDYVPLPKLSTTLHDISAWILTSIKKEISGTDPNQRACIDDLPVVAWIREHWHSEPYRDHFLFFAERLLMIRSIRPNERYWTKLQMVLRMLELDPWDAELLRRSAKCLAWLGHDREAVDRYEMAILKVTGFLPRLDYAYFLLQRERFAAAETQFAMVLEQHAARVHSYHGKSRVYLGYARALGHTQQPGRAEEYFDLAIASAMGKGLGITHYHKGLFFFDCGRYVDAKHHLQVAISHNENLALNHYKLSRVLLKLGEHDEYVQCLRHVLLLDPHFRGAQDDLDEYFRGAQQQRRAREPEVEVYNFARSEPLNVRFEAEAPVAPRGNDNDYVPPHARFADEQKQNDLNNSGYAEQRRGNAHGIVNVPVGLGPGDVGVWAPAAPRVNVPSHVRANPLPLAPACSDDKKQSESAEPDYAPENSSAREFKENEAAAGSTEQVQSDLASLRISSKASTQLSGSGSHSQQRAPETTPHNREFDRFWFDGIGRVEEDFNAYYDAFLEHRMRDIRCVLFEPDIEPKLKRLIGVETLENLQIIHTAIAELREDHAQFLAALRSANLKQFYAVFARAAIYTAEALHRAVKSEKDIARLIRRCNQSEAQQKQTARFSESDTHEIWSFVQELSE